MTQIVCANCGQALRPTDKFCYNCGAKVQPIKLKPEVEKEVPKPEPVKTSAPSVFKTQVQPKHEAPAPAPAPEKAPEERPKFHMDEAMSWNTDGYPEAQRRPAAPAPEEADFSWSDSSAQDRIKKRQEEGRKSLYEEQEAKKAAEEKTEAAATDQFSETPEAEDVVKAVDAESTIPVDSFSVEETPEEAYKAPVEAAPVEAPATEVEIPAEPAETPAPAPVEPEEPAPAEPVAEAPAEEPAVSFREAYQAEVDRAADESAKAEAEPEKAESPAESFRKAYQAEVDRPISENAEAEADDNYVVPTIESIEKDAEAAKARQTEKEIFGYTLDDIDSGARSEASGGAEVIDKFYTYSKKNEEFQALLDQENEKLKGSRPDTVKVPSDIQEKLDEVAAPEEKAKHDKPVETGGFVGVQLPETPESVEAYKEPEQPAPAPAEESASDYAYMAPKDGQPEPEKKAEFLGGTFGKADDITRNAGYHVNDDKSAAANTVAAAAGAVAAGAAAIAAARDKAKAKVEAEKKAEATAAEAPAAEEIPAAPTFDEKVAEVEDKVVEAQAQSEEAAAAAGEKVEEAVKTAEAKTDEAVAAVEDKIGQTAEAVQAKVEEKVEDTPFGEVVTEESEKEREISLADAAEEAAKAKAAEIKAAEEAAAEAEAQQEEEKPEAAQEEAEKSIDAVIEETAEPEKEPEKEEKKEEPEDDHKLTYQDVFNEETEKTPKHTFLKVLAILILLLIILEVAAILIRRFAPDSAIGLQIQQIYEMIFNRFL